LAFIIRDEKAVVTIAKSEDGGEEHRLNPGDSVRFEEVESMTELNDQSSEVDDVRGCGLRSSVILAISPSTHQ
jgi:hypothetical protein